MSINSTQVRLHLSAWYDGGCEITKFTIQYRVRAKQSDWSLVSNNLLKEQTVLINDLTPSTAYEVLVGAQNSVGRTEAKYRFMTLNSEGKQVATSSSFALIGGSSSDPNDPDFEGDETLSRVDYIDETGNRREVWLQQHRQSVDHHSTTRWFLMMLKSFLNSPMTLLFSLCFFLALLVVVVINRQTCKSTNSTSCNGSNSSNSPKGSALTCARENEGIVRRCSFDATTATILDGNSDPPLSVTNGSSSMTDVSPARVNLTGGHRMMQLACNNGQQGYVTPLVDCGASSGGNYCHGIGLSNTLPFVDHPKNHETTCNANETTNNYAVAGHVNSGYGYAPIVFYH